jgi:hypothetical protein
LPAEDSLLDPLVQPVAAMITNPLHDSDPCADHILLAAELLTAKT